MSEMIYFNGIDLDLVGQGAGVFSRPPMHLDLFLKTLPQAASIENLQPKDVVDGVDPGDLTSAGWGVIVHEDERPELLEALVALLEHRAEQVGPRFRILHYREGEDCGRFLIRHRAGRIEADPDSLPYYLMIVGSPEKIPFSFQFDLDLVYAVGRICFERAEDYAQYAFNVVYHEVCGRPSPKKAVFFGMGNGDRLTELSQNGLVTPLAVKLAKRSEGASLGWGIEVVDSEQATQARLSGYLHDGQAPALLFTASHGTTCSHDAGRRLRMQGGLVCSDWQLGQPFREEYCFFGENLDASAQMSGMIAFFFGCFTAGTPAYDTTLPKSTRVLHEHDFVAALPQAMLAHKKGALAVIGHVDQCFQHSFLWEETICEIDHFASTLGKLMRGMPIGYSMEHFNRRFASMSAWLTDLIYDPEPPQEDYVKLVRWLSLQDARNYVVLGDPAVHLRV